MGDTFMSGISFARSDIIPEPPEAGFVRLFVKTDGSMWAIDSLGIILRVTNV